MLRQIIKNDLVVILFISSIVTLFAANTIFAGQPNSGPSKELIYKIAGDFSQLSYDGNSSDIYNTLKADGWQPQCDAFQKSLSEITREIKAMSPVKYTAVNKKKATSKKIEEDIDNAVTSFIQLSKQNKLDYSSATTNTAAENEIYTKGLKNAYKNSLTADNRIEQHFGYAVGTNIINNKKVYVIAFRGTADIYSWIFTDFIAFPTEFLNTETQVHVGFEWNRQACMEQELLKACIETIKEDTSDPIIIITGHSLGGAVAVLETADFIENKIANPNNIYLVTLAEPCPGKKDFVNRYKKQIKNYKWFCNLFDPAPLAPMIVGYKHFAYLSGLILFDSKQPPIPPIKDIFGRHDLKYYREYIDGLQPDKNI